MGLVQEWIFPCVWAFLACAGFCIVFNIHGKGLLLVSLGGSLGWLVYLILFAVLSNSSAAAFGAGVLVSLYAETMARVRRCPATCYLFIAIVPLVPGLGLYQSMEYYFDGKTAEFGLKIRETLGVAGGIALGVFLVSSLMRMINQRRLAARKN
jgi:uncharacterized membrane protein YjjB (DUF3815 family)